MGQKQSFEEKLTVEVRFVLSFLSFEKVESISRGLISQRFSSGDLIGIIYGAVCDEEHTITRLMKRPRNSLQGFLRGASYRYHARQEGRDVDEGSKVYLAFLHNVFVNYALDCMGLTAKAYIDFTADIKKDFYKQIA